MSEHASAEKDAGRDGIIRAIRSLMYADNMGDVHEVINHLCALVGLPAPEGNYLDGWTDEDNARMGIPSRGSDG